MYTHYGRVGAIPREPPTLIHVSVYNQMKSTKVQTLSTVTLHATTDCTDDASIVGLGPVNWAIV